MLCNLCPRNCNTDRTKQKGFCAMGENPVVARASLHFGEEPVISGTQGSGTVFFSGCNLKCVYCQNFPISHGRFGKEITPDELSDIFLKLQSRGAHNINLVTPTQFSAAIIKALDKVKHKLEIPVVYNTGGYEKPSVIMQLKDYVDIFLTDFKYKTEETAKKYSCAADYFYYAGEALAAMYENTGKYVIENGIMKKGIIIRHLILPGLKNESIEILEEIAKIIPPKDVLLSLMSQYTPMAEAEKFPEINRKVTSLEYKRVLDKAISCGFEGFMQSRNSATSQMTPDFDLTGVN